MSSTKQDYLDVLAAIQATDEKLDILDNILPGVDGGIDFGSTMVDITALITTIQDWAQGQVDNVNQQESVINNFLLDLKALFTTYSATVEITTDGEVPYGTDYGGDGLGIKFVATQNGTTGSKVFNNNLLTSVDL